MAHGKEDPHRRAVEIPATLHERLQEACRRKGYATVSECVSSMLREVLAREEALEGAEEKLTPDAEEKVKQRLKALGYLE